jgi:hypothetical protein
MIVRVPALAGIGSSPVSFAQLYPNNAIVMQSSAGKVVDFTVYAWAGLTIAGLLWVLTKGPQATYRRQEIKKAKQRLGKARKLPRIGVPA